MSWIDGLRHRMRVLLRPNAYEDEVREEFEFHRELAQINGTDARQSALQFGNHT